MQPELSDKSQLFNFLKSYLNNKNRLQPIIGLCSIVECVNVGSDNRETLYFCEVCVCRVTKADIQNHIQGSRHRFSYIKTCHPHLARKWEKDADLSKLAWPLMELATVLERREGPGNVQLFEVPEAAYLKMATESENHAVMLMNVLRDGGAESGSFSEILSLHYPIESQRVVLLTQNQPEDTKPHMVSAQNEGPCHTENTQTSPENSSFVENFSGATPPIGLNRVIGFKSENGRLHCFLCHCCRVKCNTNDIIDHLTSSSHLFNYLMETHPNLVEGMSENSEANFHLLPPLANKVEQLEGRGQMEIINVPESFCKQLSGKSYHWCLRMQSSVRVNLDVPVKREGVAEPVEPKKNAKAVAQQVKETLRKKRKKKKKKRKTNTMFNISLPIHKGAVLLERTSFDEENLLEQPSSPLFDPGPVLPPADCNTSEIHQEEIPSEMESFQLKQQVDEGYGGYAAEEQIKITVRQDTSENFHQLVEREYDGRGSGEKSGYNRYEDWLNEDTQNERPFPPESHGNDWFDSRYRHEGGDPGLWFRLKQPSRQARNRNRSRNTHSGSVQYYRRQHQHQMAWADGGPRVGSPWRHPDLSSQVSSFIETARTNMQTHSGHAPAYGCSISEPSFMSWNQYDYSQYQTAPQGYTTPSENYQISQINQTSYNTDPIQLSAPPVSSGGYEEAADWGSMHPNAFIQSGQAVVYGAGSDVYFRAGTPY
uniref:Uncharacterized protein n=1 Tax=Iconisemion striatum TaxID=60296 RepID=A0A1A7XWJ9_9TELE